MPAKRMLALSLAALLLAPALPALAAEEAAKTSEKESEEGVKTERATLADKIAPVSGNLFVKAHRFEISPTIGLSLDDAFFQKFAFGIKLNYHFLESFSVGIHFSYSVAIQSGAVNVCKPTGCGTPTMEDLQNLPGHISLLTGLDLAWSPFYGKVNILGEKVLHFDTAVFIGASLIGYQVPERPGTRTAGQTGFTGGFHFGLGERFFITSFMTLRVELRDYLYSAEIPTLSGSDTKLENQLMLELGLSFFLGGG